MLSADDFASFFREVHGLEPFPWQKRLARAVADQGVWPDTLHLPTGSGKTAAIDVAVFHLALEASRERGRRAPVRVAFVVDRRLVVDDAFTRARRLADALSEPVGPVVSRVAEQLKKLALDGPPLVARRLRGGIPREHDWTRTPSQPTVLCSTVDQIGSRLLFRGYGVSDSMKPVHAGLIGSDCLLLLDEVHLAEPFRQTLRWVQCYKGEHWHQDDAPAPWHVAFLSATPGDGSRNTFALDDEDRSHPVLERRLNASKPARLVTAARPKGKTSETAADDGEAADDVKNDADTLVSAIAEEVRLAFEHFRTNDNGVPVPALAVVVNRVARARAVFKRLKDEFKQEIERGSVAEPILMIGPARQLDRNDLVSRLETIRTATWKDDEVRILDTTLIVVATQCVEAGVDLDFDALVTEAAPVDALRQRFGRVNRAGRKISPYAAVVLSKSDLSGRHDDPVYGKAIKTAWDYLIAQAEGTAHGMPLADFGIGAFDRRIEKEPTPPDALAEKVDAPVLLPAHLDLLSQTSPIPSADPDVALYLHGARRQPDSITVIWRADIDPENTGEDTRQILMLVPPRSGEAIELPLWTVRRWLLDGTPQMPDVLSDVAANAPEDRNRLPADGGDLRVFRWKGDDERSAWVKALDLLPGDTIVVPSIQGGYDEFGWDPQSKAPVTDVAAAALEPFMSRRFAVRVAPGLLGSSVPDHILADTLASAVSQQWKDVRAGLLDLSLPEAIRASLETLDAARKRRVIAYMDLYGRDLQGRPRGVVFYAPLGISGAMRGEDGGTYSSEDDIAGSLPGFPLSLAVHNDDVARKVAIFAEASGFPAMRVADLGLAGRLHDVGKQDSRFQAWLHYGDPLGAADHAATEDLLAKSGRRLAHYARDTSGLPDRWRHEALSVRLARVDPELAKADDPELVLWLIGTHHGYGRPLFPHGDPAEKTPDVGPQSLAFEWRGLDWATLFERLTLRYGVWGLAHMEAVLRLADHRASEERAVKEHS